jgi:four helix bundle protein
MECAACIDIAGIKELLVAADVCREKPRLSELARMLVGLRKSWVVSELREEPPDGPGSYSARSVSGFAHEQLSVYRTALEFVRWLYLLPGGAELSCRGFREVDRAATSMVLNIAEGNGRFSDADRRRFLDIAEAAAVKAAAWLDLCEQRRQLDRKRARRGIELLDCVAQMLAKLAASQIPAGG